MKKIGYILVGILIGILIQHQFKASSKKVIVKTDEEVVDDSQIALKTKSIPVQKKDINPKRAESIKNPETKKFEILSPEPSLNSVTETKPSTPPRKLELTFSEEIVTELESNLQDLPNQIRLNQEQEGLRVSYLSEKSIFTKVGFQTGDLIRYEILQNLKNATGPTGQLSARLVNVINYVR